MLTKKCWPQKNVDPNQMLTPRILFTLQNRWPPEFVWPPNMLTPNFYFVFGWGGGKKNWPPTFQNPMIIPSGRKVTRHKDRENFRWRRWGSLHAWPSTQPPINTSGNLSARVSAESPSKISPNPSEVLSEVWNPRTTFENTPFFQS